MNHQKFQLRGHHIGTFAVHYGGKDFYRPKYDKIIPIGEKEEYNKNLDKLHILGDKQKELSDSSRDTITAVYGKRMKNVMDTVYALLQSQPDLEVEIVAGLDSICKAGCPRLQPSCATSSSDDEDTLALETYGLEVGRTYTARDIIQRVRTFTARTGIRSPRDIKIAEIQAQAFS
jgi:hypothetical protein